MSRSLKKGPYVDPKIIAKVHKAKADNDRTPIKTWSRSCTITPDMVGVSFAVHNGRKFIEFTVDENMVGHKFGEFSPTRTFKAHSGKLAKESTTKPPAPKPQQK
ncbi:MAG: SSU ribosomal protein S19P [Candidatus Magasanikbacteria bacterium GW2011_GWD2_43_18]|uniref:Small ribosomal subunit protein uS19 n=1 Tax=Candidatus Magasanikbacteria bacterium GW2011_GWE2_42_7 TaxID=1619052 RepID=A0A0G1DJU1_9BACT|nr:MAG: SSU ribosomal protein S19P [Candidatus Magasanikbacteria bacterium GW2011_GWC2_42_27]KKS71106.1 MAG: SSU ribosomal protein S19P [Candidatus Magasanikbacteria bacterium GW2011_GWE2_42_7]KKT04299.1 MAG: SSU ribosomal protein S19P [Candidatus Magasanikbacteria bacterium GW2011_GWD2_43_18]KKT24874.1 MAG: SSU ribosomal protein S19P [Candidatus Magasanikbacteria bacterium GW2011_GWA2_43_9]HBB38357.1 30S ribosomal protein S19 [Candidatus Magasanikbacteria bacterium]